MSWIRVGVLPEGTLPRDRLTESELSELRTLMHEREALLSRARGVEQQIQLLLLLARDRRDLRGQVRADPETGALEVNHGEPG